MTPKRKPSRIVRPIIIKEQPQDKFGFVFKSDIKHWMYTETKLYNNIRNGKP
jgi:hypothetical protein